MGLIGWLSSGFPVTGRFKPSLPDHLAGQSIGDCAVTTELGMNVIDQLRAAQNAVFAFPRRELSELPLM